MSNKSIRMAFVNMRHTAVALRQRIVTRAERQMCDEIIDQADFWEGMLREGAPISWDTVKQELGTDPTYEG